MATIEHKNITGDDAVHPSAYVASSDPGAVGAGKHWIDTTGGTGAWVHKVRDAANTGWETISGGGGGGSGLPELLGYAFSNSSSVVNPDPTSDTTIPGMSVTFTIASSRDVRMTAFIRLQKNTGQIRGKFYEGTNPLTTVAVANTAWYSVVSAGQEAGNNALKMCEIHTMAAGTYTITVKEQATGSTDSCTYAERSLVIEALS